MEREVDGLNEIVLVAHGIELLINPGEHIATEAAPHGTYQPRQASLILIEGHLVCIPIGEPIIFISYGLNLP